MPRPKPNPDEPHDGRIVQRNISGDAITVIDVRHLASGTYTVVCNTGTASRAARFMKL